MIVSGWQVYNNKGEVVEKFEPFYAKGYTYARPIGNQDGAKIRMYYDPRGRLVKTVNADDTETRVIFGEPQATNLNPDGLIDWNPWDTFTYDANDLDSASISHNTPDSQSVDCLGRVVTQVRRIKSDTSTPLVQAVTRFTYDIRGNLLQVLDAEHGADYPAFSYGYDLLNRQLYRFNIDQAVTVTVLDPVGNIIEIDSLEVGNSQPNKCSFTIYNNLNQPVKAWKLNTEPPYALWAFLRQEFQYGADTFDDRFYNRYNKLTVRYDEGGRNEFPFYDFKGNITSKITSFYDDDDFKNIIGEASDFGHSTNWSFQSYEILGTLCYSSDTLLQQYEFDALNRPITLQGPGASYTYHYDRSGQLHKLVHTPTSQTARFVELYYNAKGQNLLEYMSNGLMTRYRYDKENFRLQHSKTEPCTKTVTSSTIAFATAANAVQNLYYAYDKVGNVLDKKNVMPTGLEEYAFHQTAEYDSLYRLLKATGQEAGSPGNYLPNDGNMPGMQPTSRVDYEQYFEYDKVGNLLTLDHCHNNVTQYKRKYTIQGESNQFEEVSVGSNHFDYKYDQCGNVIYRSSATDYAYNQAGQLIFTKVQAGGIPSVVAFYTYNAEGQRTKKVVWKDNGKYEATIYLDGIFEKTYTFSESVPLIESQTYTHMVAADRKLFSYRTGDLMGDLTPADKWTMQDALGSVSCTTDGSGTVLSVECYYAFGETAFGSYSKKRYRYCGKERDGETGLYYYGARYYDAWTCRFVSVDPLADEYAYLSPYNYAGNNPISYMDVDGMQSEANEKSPEGGKSTTNSREGATKETFSSKVVHALKSFGKDLKAAWEVAKWTVKNPLGRSDTDVVIPYEDSTDITKYRGNGKGGWILTTPGGNPVQEPQYDEWPEFVDFIWDALVGFPNAELKTEPKNVTLPEDDQGLNFMAKLLELCNAVLGVEEDVDDIKNKVKSTSETTTSDSSYVDATGWYQEIDRLEKIHGKGSVTRVRGNYPNLGDSILWVNDGLSIKPQTPKSSKSVYKTVSKNTSTKR